MQPFHMQSLYFVSICCLLIGSAASLPSHYALADCGGASSAEYSQSRLSPTVSGCMLYEYCYFHGLGKNSSNGGALEISSSTSLRLVRCRFESCLSNDHGGAVYFTQGTFEAAGCCASHCDADRGAGFYLSKHASDSRAKLTFCSFLECSYSPDICNTGALAGDAVPLDCQNVNFSSCQTKMEGSAISIETQRSLLRFVSVEGGRGNPLTAVDFDDTTSGNENETLIENSRIIDNKVSLGAVYSSGGRMRCRNCYFKGNTYDFSRTILQGVTITAEQCFFASALQTDDWLTKISCVASYTGTMLDLCLPAIGACSQLQICTTAQFSVTKRLDFSQRMTTSNRFVLASGRLAATFSLKPSSILGSSPGLKSTGVVAVSSYFSASLEGNPSSDIIPTFAIVGSSRFAVTANLPDEDPKLPPPLFDSKESASGGFFKSGAFIGLIVGIVLAVIIAVIVAASLYRRASYEYTDEEEIEGRPIEENLTSVLDEDLTGVVYETPLTMNGIESPFYEGNSSSGD
jgi:hypothetical protein